MFGSAASSIPFMLFQLYIGEPTVIFSSEEVQDMAKPFKLAFVGMFSFGWPSMMLL